MGAVWDFLGEEVVGRGGRPDLTDPDDAAKAVIEARWRAIQAEKRQAALEGHPPQEAIGLVPKPVRRARPLDTPDLESIPDDDAIRKVREKVEAYYSPEAKKARRRGFTVANRSAAVKASHARRRSATTERVLEAGAKLAPPGSPLSLKAIANAAGVSDQTVFHVKKRLAAEGRWPWAPAIGGKATAVAPTPIQPAGDARPPEPRTESPTCEEPSMSTTETMSISDRVLAESQRRLAAGLVLQPNEMAEVLDITPKAVSNWLYLLRRAGRLPKTGKGQPGRRTTKAEAPALKPRASTPAPKSSPHVNGSAIPPVNRLDALEPRDEPETASDLEGLAQELAAASAVVGVLKNLSRPAARRVVGLVHGLLEGADE